MHAEDDLVRASADAEALRRRGLIDVAEPDPAPERGVDPDGCPGIGAAEKAWREIAALRAPAASPGQIVRPQQSASAESSHLIWAGPVSCINAMTTP